MGLRTGEIEKYSVFSLPEYPGKLRPKGIHVLHAGNAQMGREGVGWDMRMVPKQDPHPRPLILTFWEGHRKAETEGEVLEVSLCSLLFFFLLKESQNESGKIRRGIYMVFEGFPWFYKYFIFSIKKTIRRCERKARKGQAVLSFALV